MHGELKFCFCVCFVLDARVLCFCLCLCLRFQLRGFRVYESMKWCNGTKSTSSRVIVVFQDMSLMSMLCFGC